MKALLILCLILIVGVTDPDKNYLLGKFDPASDTRFSKLRPEHTSGAAIGGYLRKETYAAFVTMAEAAKKDGIRLTIISATRNFESQKQIWENKWNGKVRVEGEEFDFGKKPGRTSQDHFAGTVRCRVVPVTIGVPIWISTAWRILILKSGDGLKIYQWLTTHAGLNTVFVSLTHPRPTAVPAMKRKNGIGLTCRCPSRCLTSTSKTFTTKISPDSKEAKLRFP